MAKRGWEQVNRAQLCALQALHAKWSSASIASAQSERAARLAWASATIGRSVSSFSDLTMDEARRLIDVLKTSLGQKLTRQASHWRRIYESEPAQQAGTAGRKGNESALVQLCSVDDLARISEARERLGWSEERYQIWLQSSRSPLETRDKTIRTLADANRVYWALKAMIVRTGRWEKTRAVSGCHTQCTTKEMEKRGTICLIN